VQQPAPMVHVPQQLSAHAELEQLESSWAQLELDDVRGALNGARDYILKYPTDPSVPHVRVHVALICVKGGDTAGAQFAIAPLALEPDGATRDLAQVVRAHVLRIQKNPVAALALLRPLAGKIIDGLGRDLLMEELALAAVDGRNEFEAIAYMNAWLDGVSAQDREHVRARVRELLVAMPTLALLAAYKPMRAQGSASGYSADMRRQVASVLADDAVARGDSELARWLLDPKLGGAPPSSGGSTDLRDLAASTRGLRNVSGRTIGLLLPGGSAVLRDEASDVARGVSWALGLPRSVRDDNEIRLVTRDSGTGAGSTEDALEELAGEGAAIIIGGFDEASATRALQWGDAAGISVITLVPPSFTARPRHGFIIGERESDQLPLLAAALHAHGHKQLMAVSREPMREATASYFGIRQVVPCEPTGRLAGRSQFPLAEIRRENAGLLVAASFECMRDLGLDIGRYEPQLLRTTYIAGTLGAGNPFPDPRTRDARYLLVSAGVVPIRTTDPGAMPTTDLRNYLLTYGTPPNYWAALGRDAGVLARSAVSPLPQDVATSDASIYQRRALVEAGLMATKDDMWSSDERGFDADRTLKRTMGVVEVRGGVHVYDAPSVPRLPQQK
jgi:hypothetical protein